MGRGKIAPSEGYKGSKRGERACYRALSSRHNTTLIYSITLWKSVQMWRLPKTLTRSGLWISLIEGMGKARLGPGWEILEKTLEISCPWAVQLSISPTAQESLVGIRAWGLSAGGMERRFWRAKGEIREIDTGVLCGQLGLVKWGPLGSLTQSRRRGGSVL